MKLNRVFFDQNPVKVAEELLGKTFVRYVGHNLIAGKIVETEAYWGENDLACHARFGKTNRTKTLYEKSGHLYVYLNYGIFYLTNIVCEKGGKPGGVLIRSAQIIKGEAIVRDFLNKNKFVKSDMFMATGPGKLSIAFNIEKEQNGLDVITSKNIYIEKPTEMEEFDIIKTTRVGVEYAKHCKDYPWRFYIKDNKFVSKK